MRRSFTTLFALLVTLCCLPPLPAQIGPGEGRLGGEEISERLAGHTVRLRTEGAPEEETTLEIYRADGTLFTRDAGGDRHQGTWRVDDRERLCRTLEDESEYCLAVVATGEAMRYRKLNDPETPDEIVLERRQGDPYDLEPQAVALPETEGPPTRLDAENIRQELQGRTVVILREGAARAASELYYFAEDGTLHRRNRWGNLGTGTWRAELGRLCRSFTDEVDECLAVFYEDDTLVFRNLDRPGAPAERVEERWEGDHHGLADRPTS